ncbi:hypothetical protein D9619_010742 [Psilocybe cf. subviscida]|uniref:Uncharacterized protein n=1 Tax=Psilocybe cf. subviscida TaxID=2480587 RepID=A0A8H5BAE8_9AGAR|nr:hypothetical protein D9619_010742 [Psilocybe cf. subviscida]
MKTDNTFATVTIFLPSAYTGGEVVLSHTSNSTTIGFAPESAYASAVLAMYADIPCENRPVSWGYRLALSYNLIHTTAPTERCPLSPRTLDAATLLRNMFRRWRDTLDNYETEQYFMTYLLDQTYDLKDVKDVVTCLKGVDAYRVRILRDIGAELGFTLGIANLEYETGRISDVIKGFTDLKQLTGLDGQPLFGLTKPLELLRGSVIMVSDFASKGSSSAKRKYDGGSENGGKCSVLLLIDSKHHDDLRFEVEGLPVAAQVLRETSQIPPTRENIKWAKRILQHRNEPSKEYTPDVSREMLTYSLDWKNLELWKLSMDSYKWDFHYVHSDILFRVYRTFPFDEIRERSSLWRDDSMEGPMEMITFLHSLAAEAAKENGNQTVQSWCEQSVKEVLSSCSPKDPSHAESILQVIRLVGMQLCGQHMLPYLIDHDNEQYFGFWMALHVLLRDQRQSLLQDLSKSHPDPHVPTTADSLDENKVAKARRSTADILNDLITISLLLPGFAWFKEHRPYSNDFGGLVFGCPRAKFDPIPGRINRLVSVLGACVHSNDMTLCESVLEQALEMSGNPMWYFAEFYTPVIRRLRDILEPLNQDFSQPPFADFARKLISRYLSQVLGKRGPVIDIGLRKLSCAKPDCAICKKVDAFILSKAVNKSKSLASTCPNTRGNTCPDLDSQVWGIRRSRSKSIQVWI